MNFEWRKISINKPLILQFSNSLPMAYSSSSRSFAGFLVVLMVFRLDANGCYTSIISFGDSIADTGNVKHLASLTHQPYPSLFPPYGETFFHQPTGRSSDGRLIIDFLAESLGLPFIPPYMTVKGNDSLRQGINYAVGAATSLDSRFLQSDGIKNPVSNASLSVQLGWFKHSLSSICDSALDCRKLIGRSLILMGEIGGNDYNYLLHDGTPIDEIEPHVPLVVHTIVSAINELIEMGAKTLVVPGNFPIGCSSVYLTIRASEKQEEYDPSTGCLIRLNEFSEYHNKLLQTKLNQIREARPNVNVIYADYYNATMQIYRSPHKFGFTSDILNACCGGGGPFNYNFSAACGDASATVCDQPDKYANWDGVHLTEAAYEFIFKSLFHGPYTTPQFNSLCPASSTSQLGIRSFSSM